MKYSKLNGGKIEMVTHRRAARPNSQEFRHEFHKSEGVTNKAAEMSEQGSLVGSIPTSSACDGRNGDEVGNYNNFVIIVPNTELNKKYEIKITKIYEKINIGEI
jgi:hypothetical protein